VLGDVNEDHVVPELQFLERLYRLMVAAEAMDIRDEEDAAPLLRASLSVRVDTLA
jgi:hypothetical protein